MTRATLSFTSNSLLSWNSSLLVALGSEDAILVVVLKASFDVCNRGKKFGLARTLSFEMSWILRLTTRDAALEAYIDTEGNKWTLDVARISHGY